MGRGDPLEQSLPGARPRVHRGRDPARRALDRSRPRRRRSSSICSSASGSRRAAPRTGASPPTPSSIVASGDKHWFLTHGDLFEATDDVHVRPARGARAHAGDPQRARRREDEALLHRGSRRALARAAAKEERESLGAVRDLLEKDNYELATVDTTRARRARAVRGMRRRGHRGAARAVLERGGEPPARPGSWREAASSRPSGRPTRATGRWPCPTGLDEALAPFGIALDDVVVHDVGRRRRDPRHARRGVLRDREAAPGDREPRAAPRTRHPPRVATFFARSLRHVSPPGAAVASRPARHDRRTPTRRRASRARRRGRASRRAIRATAAARSSSPWPRSERRLPARRTDRASSSSGSRFALAEDNWRQPRSLHGDGVPRRQRALVARVAARGRRRARPRRGGRGDAHHRGRSRRGPALRARPHAARGAAPRRGRVGLAALVGEHAVRAGGQAPGRRGALVVSPSRSLGSVTPIAIVVLAVGAGAYAYVVAPASRTPTGMRAAPTCSRASAWTR